MSTNPSRKHRAQGSRAEGSAEPTAGCPCPWPCHSQSPNGARQHSLELQMGQKRVEGPVRGEKEAVLCQGWTLHSTLTPPGHTPVTWPTGSALEGSG